MESRPIFICNCAWPQRSNNKEKREGPKCFNMFSPAVLSPIHIGKKENLLIRYTKGLESPRKNELNEEVKDREPGKQVTPPQYNYKYKYKYKMQRQIPVRRALRTSAPCPESHRRLARRFPSLGSSDENPPKTFRLINIVLTLLQDEITGNHRLNRVPMMFRRSSARR